MGKQITLKEVFLLIIFEKVYKISYFEKKRSSTVRHSLHIYFSIAGIK